MASPEQKHRRGRNLLPALPRKRVEGRQGRATLPTRSASGVVISCGLSAAGCEAHEIGDAGISGNGGQDCQRGRSAINPCRVNLPICCHDTSSASAMKWSATAISRRTCIMEVHWPPEPHTCRRTGRRCGIRHGNGKSFGPRRRFGKSDGISVELFQSLRQGKIRWRQSMGPRSCLQTGGRGRVAQATGRQQAIGVPTDA